MAVMTQLELSDVATDSICCASETKEDGYSVWVTTSTQPYNSTAHRIRVLPSGMLEVSKTVVLTPCSKPMSIHQSEYYVYIGCENGTIVKLRTYDMTFPDIITPEIGIGKDQSSAVDDGTYGYFSYSDFTNISIVQLHGMRHRES